MTEAGIRILGLRLASWVRLDKLWTYWIITSGSGPGASEFQNGKSDDGA
jgi:hypothetical protein